MTDLLELLKNNPYPGRGIVVGKDRVYYFIMGRSQNSRNRIFSLTDDGIRTEAFDPALVKDPSLIIYHPVRKIPGALIVTNGDQTDTIKDMKDFRGALMTREYEPDDPNFTPASPPSSTWTAPSSWPSSSGGTAAACGNSSSMRA